jgi:penicillin-binding protein 1A
MDVIRIAEGKRPSTEFAVPSGIETALIDPATGLLAYEGEKEAIQEVFLTGTVPTETARLPDSADPNTFLMEQFGNAEPAE